MCVCWRVCVSVCVFVCRGVIACVCVCCYVLVCVFFYSVCVFVYVCECVFVYVCVGVAMSVSGNVLWFICIHAQYVFMTEEERQTDRQTDSEIDIHPPKSMNHNTLHTAAMCIQTETNMPGVCPSLIHSSDMTFPCVWKHLCLLLRTFSLSNGTGAP